MTRFALRGVGALAAAALVALAPASASAASPKQKANATQALTNVQQLSKGKGVKTGHELTPALNQLYAQLPSLSAGDRATAEALFARPDGGGADPGGTHKWDPSAVVGVPYTTAHFAVHYVLTSADSSTAAHAKEIGDVLENEVYPCENGTGATACAGRPALGWRPPASDGTLGGDGRTDVYIEDLFTSQRVFGYVALDPGQTRDPSVPHYAYMVMDKDYTRFGDGSVASGLAAERVTAAHEYNHMLQNAYDYFEDPWMFEATAVYMEDKVYPDNNDYLNYVRHWVANSRQPLTTFSDANLKAYGSAVWNHWLDYRFGPGAVRASWEDSIAAADFAPGAYNAAVAAFGGGGFADEFSRFSAAVAEWETPGAGFPDRYPDVPRDGTLPGGGATLPFPLAHTTFAFLDVPIPAGAPSTIRLTGTLPAATAGAIALVGRTGADPTAGVVTTNLTQMPSGGSATASLDNPGQFGRITAVVVNADASRNGFDPAVEDWIFTKDAAGVTLSLAEPGLPIAATGAPAAIADHSATVGATVDPHLLETTWVIEYGRTAAYGSRTVPQTVAAATVGAAPLTAALAKLRAATTYHYRVVATNGAGQMPGADATFKTARDVTKPTVTLKVARQRLGRRFVYRLRCSERCTGTAKLAAKRRTLAKTKVALDALPNSKTFKLRLGRKARALKRPLSVVFEVRVADGSGNAVKLRRRLRLT